MANLEINAANTGDLTSAMREWIRNCQVTPKAIWTNVDEVRSLLQLSCVICPYVQPVDETLSAAPDAKS